MRGSSKIRLHVLLITWLKTSPIWFAFFWGALLGLGVFIFIYGVYVIIPTHVTWLTLSSGDSLVVGGDLKQYFLGWEYFRSGAWTFPLGVIQSLAYPTGLPVTYTDSIPLFALPFKLISGILPSQFQYFGIWGVMCYCLQGGLAALIVRKWSKNIGVILLGTLFFVLSPVLAARMMIHMGLAGQWVILLGVLLMIYWRKYNTTKRMILLWSGMLVLTVLVHPYFVPMVMLLFLTTMVMSHSHWLATILKVMIPSLAMMVVFWAIGGLSVTSTSAGGLGVYSFNLDSLVNPFGWSRFLPTLPIPTNSEETMNYLGLGMLLMVIGVFVIALVKFCYEDRLKRTIRRFTTWRTLIIIVLFVGLFVMAVSPEVQFNNTVLFSYHVPHKIEAVWSTFRASARLFWVFYYLIFVGVIAAMIRSFKKATMALIVCLVIFAGIQTVDIMHSPNMQAKRASLTAAATARHTPQVTMAQWLAFAAGKTHLVYVDAGLTTDDAYTLADIAVANGMMTMNDGYYARKPDIAIAQNKAIAIAQLKTDTLDSSTVYVTKDAAFYNQLQSKDVNAAFLSNGGFYAITVRHS